MHTINARNVNWALPAGMQYLINDDNVRIITPRKGAGAGGDVTREALTPVATVYTDPCERVLWDPLRDANPFFHFFEALWILAGRKDVGFLSLFNKRMANYSDDGIAFHAPYGYRMRHSVGHHLMDQVFHVISLLSREPGTRRAVLQIWDAGQDLNKESKDLPCNDLVFLKVRDERLHITVCCRSNDVVWGAYGANVVQFSMLQEYIAAHLGVAVGTYTQVSDSYHVYESNAYWQDWVEKYGGSRSVVDGYMPVNPEWDHYHHGGLARVHPYPLFAEPERFDSDLNDFFNRFDKYLTMPGPGTSWRTKAFKEVVEPLWRAHCVYRGLLPIGHPPDLSIHMAAQSILDTCAAEDWRLHMAAQSILDTCAAEDWRLACTQWLDRRA